MAHATRHNVGPIGPSPLAASGCLIVVVVIVVAAATASTSSAGNGNEGGSAGGCSRRSVISCPTVRAMGTQQAPDPLDYGAGHGAHDQFEVQNGVSSSHV